MAKKRKARPKPTPHPKAVERGREHLTEDEVAALARAAKKIGRHGARDSLVIKLAAQHGLRVSELCAMRRSQFDLNTKHVTVNRLKNGNPANLRVKGEHVRELRALWRQYTKSRYVFETDRGTPLDRTGVYKIVERAGQEAGFDFAVHPHMLRHACGYRLANNGVDTRSIQDFLGQKNIQHTVRYTRLEAGRFDDIEDD